MEENMNRQESAMNEIFGNVWASLNKIMFALVVVSYILSLI